MKRTLRLAALTALLCACAGSPKRWCPDCRAHYLSQSQVEHARLPPPPAPGSPADAADLAELREWQQRRTPAQCAGAAAQADYSFGNLFGAVSPFPSPLPPAAAGFIEAAGTDTALAVRAVKKRYRRPRPFRRDAALRPCPGMEKTGGLSYPSGHAAAARVIALALCDVQPRRCVEFQAAADAAALNRVIGGVHHPSDIEMGKRLANELYAQMQENPAFRADLEAVGRLAKP